MSGRMGTGRGWRWESALQWGSSLRHRREGVRESGAATPARCLPHRLPRRIAHPPRLLPGHFTAREARAQTGFGVADQKTKGRTPGPCARKRVGTSPCQPGAPGTRPGLYLPGNFPETALTPRGASLEAGCILGSPLQRRGRGLGHRRPSPGAPGPASRRGRPTHGFPRRPHCRLPGRRLSRPRCAHEEAEAQRGPRSTQGHTADRWQGWGLKPACGPNPPPHLCLWEGSRMKSSPGPGPPDPLIRTTW